MRRISQSHGYVLPAVLLFLAAAFGMWAVMFHGAGSVLRVEQARSQRASRTVWTAPAMADALRLLETGTPPTDPYNCKLTLTQNGETRYFLLNFEEIASGHWRVQASPTTADAFYPDAPSSF